MTATNGMDHDEISLARRDPPMVRAYLTARRVQSHAVRVIGLLVVALMVAVLFQLVRTGASDLPQPVSPLTFRV